MTLIVAVDPGGVCGMARAGFEGGEVRFFHSWEDEPMGALKYVEAVAPEIDYLAYETFTPRPGVYTWQPDAVYTIGAILYLANRYGFDAAGQSPADAKKFSTNEKLSKLNWRNPSRGGHQDDAARHVLLRAVKTKVLDLEVLL